MYQKILIANDGSDGAAKALAVALKLAHRLKAKLHMICVEEMPRVPATIDEVIEDKLEREPPLRAGDRTGPALRPRPPASSSRRTSSRAMLCRASSRSSSARASICW